MRTIIEMEAGHEYEVIIDSLSTLAPSPSQVRTMASQAIQLDFCGNLPSCLIPEISAPNSQCDIALIFTASNKEYESESFDLYRMT